MMAADEHVNWQATCVIYYVLNREPAGENKIVFYYRTEQERPAVADKPARRLRNDCTVKAVGL